MMNSHQLPADLSFARWMQHVFDHPAPTSSGAQIWHFQADAAFWDELAQPERTIAYLTHLFNNIDRLAAPYTDAQLDQGLNYLISNACSSHMFALMDLRVPIEDRLTCVESFYSVYALLYAQRCTPDLGHLNTDMHQGNPLNHTCYMWWDTAPFIGKSGNPAAEALDTAMLNVMIRTLELPHEACQEGALHGLGHWHRAYPAVVEAAIDGFLPANPSRSSALTAYAQAARSGCVL